MSIVAYGYGFTPVGTVVVDNLDVSLDMAEIDIVLDPEIIIALDVTEILVTLDEEIEVEVDC